MSTKRETTPAAEKKTTVKKAPTERKTTAPRKTKAAAADASELTPSADAKVAKPKKASTAPQVAAVKPSAERAIAPMTRVMAYIDVGPGNTLFLRGEGAGLSWEAGVPMQWTGDGCWSWSAEAAGQEVTFKVLINDQHWSWGDNLKVSAGDTASFTPAF